ncbi:unnamed protein product [Linum tenue]|uniref:Uncharacterized protein n=1 Tax=Linum tenue TaxID=586396 RepID=A0AAV0PR42_9ROSI|nr:unnamed protein product [Linum tenue]
MAIGAHILALSIVGMALIIVGIGVRSLVIALFLIAYCSSGGREGNRGSSKVGIEIESDAGGNRSSYDRMESDAVEKIKLVFYEDREDRAP